MRPTQIGNPADLGIGHEWTYLPDTARTLLELLARRNDRLLKVLGSEPHTPLDEAIEMFSGRCGMIPSRAAVEITANNEKGPQRQALRTLYRKSNKAA